ncbi:sequestosome-1-like [Haliotis rufescens]|uniref:sequestosome-1-like n=1 Tax=Haliotis rufescens TaxID=6454 RepID=UPI001EAFAE5D|nr:sequestosome-1-like [Haliotis rufescens]
MSVVIKAFLERDGDPKAEIRRFGVPADASSSFTYMFKKVSEVFPGLVTGHFNLFWKDSDGDLVSFSSDEELMEALGFVTDSVFRIYVREHAPPSSPNNSSSSSGGSLHPNVVCDGCEGAVRGIRYKCCVCPDYDLCSQCEAKKIHSEHDMFKIVDPVNSCGPGRMPFRPPPHFRRWMKRYMNRWHNRHGGCGMDTEGDGAPGADSDPNQEGGQEAGPEEEYLHNVGENVAAMLDPFGIDVSFDVEHPGRRRGGPCHGAGRRGCRGFGGGWGFGWGGHRGHGHRFRHCHRRYGTNQDKEAGKEDEEMKEQADAKTAGPKQQGTAAKMAEDGSGSSETPVTEKMKDLQINGGPGNCEGEWTLLSSSRSPSSPPHPDPKISEALQQMSQMGFTNDGGWLTRLLEAKNGDISQVLDAIKPDRRTNGGYLA